MMGILKIFEKVGELNKARVGFGRKTLSDRQVWLAAGRRQRVNVSLRRGRRGKHPNDFRSPRNRRPETSHVSLAARRHKP